MHPLVTYTRRTFGDRFADVILAGYGDEAGRGELFLCDSTGTVGEVVRRRSLELSGDLPHHDEPLVLAALLKLLLSKVPPTAELDFEMLAVLRELGWADTPTTRGEVDRIIRKYLRLSYGVRSEQGGEELGMYALITGYDRDDEMQTGGRAVARSSYRVLFHPGFVEGLKESRVVFAGIDFGEVNPAGLRAGVINPAT